MKGRRQRPLIGRNDKETEVKNEKEQGRVRRKRIWIKGRKQSINIG